MKLTKLEHAGIIIERQGAKLIIDPGKFTTPVTESAGTVAIVVTHEHDDHWTPAQLTRIAERNPGLRVFASAGAAELIAAEAIADLGPVQVPAAGGQVTVGPFELGFFGGIHAEIHRSIPRVSNIGVVINGEFVSAGDSYEPPLDANGQLLPVGTLAVPTYGPWMRIADSLDFIERLRPARVLGVHEMLLAKAGKTLAATRLRAAVEAVDGVYLDLQPYESVELPD